MSGQFRVMSCLQEFIFKGGRNESFFFVVREYFIDNRILYAIIWILPWVTSLELCNNDDFLNIDSITEKSKPTKSWFDYVYVGSVPVWTKLDSGADVSVYSLSLCNELNLNVKTDRKLNDLEAFGGQVVTPVGYVNAKLSKFKDGPAHNCIVVVEHETNPILCFQHICALNFQLPHYDEINSVTELNPIIKEDLDVFEGLGKFPDAMSNYM